MADFIRPLAVVTYKHVSFCYAATNLATIATTFVWTYSSFQRIEFHSNQIATWFTEATERHHGLWIEYLFNLLIHIKKIEIFSNETVERIQKWMVCHYKRYSILTFVLLPGFFDIKFNFPCFRIYQFFRIFSFYEPWPHFLFVFLTQSHSR